MLVFNVSYNKHLFTFINVKILNDNPNLIKEK